MQGRWLHSIRDTIAVYPYGNDETAPQHVGTFPVLCGIFCLWYIIQPLKNNVVGGHQFVEFGGKKSLACTLPRYELAVCTQKIINRIVLVDDYFPILVLFPV